MKKYFFGTIFIIFAIVFLTQISSAQTVDELKAQISSTNSQIEKLNKEIKALSTQIAATSEQKNTLANAVKSLTLKRDKLLKEKTTTEKKIKSTGLVISSLDNEIGVKNTILSKSKEALSNLINNLYQRDNETFLAQLLSQNSISDMSREYNNIVDLNSEINNNINNVSLQKNNLSKSKNQKEIEQDALNQLKNTLTAQQLEIEANKKEKNQLLIETQNKESNYKKILADTQKRKESFEKSIEDYEAQIKFILNPKLIPKVGSGVLSWPLSYILITSPYGSRWGRFHYGLDFRAAVGTSVKAMATGVVMGTGDTDIACKGASFGKWVFIKYNNGLSSTYGHLSSISAKVGDKVKAGDIVALSGNTGSSTGPHLHVAVYASDGVKVDTVPSKSCGGKIFTQPISALSAYLDPGLYLPTITSTMVKK
jgi:murein DD-endopeptidase MepM/ murein hydrolase activator NlpD